VTLTHRDALLVVAGVLLPTFMGSLDQTILANALPTNGRAFGSVREPPWLITAYLLASTAIIPLYGKIADVHGRRFTLRIALLAHMAGSLVCALAPGMPVLIAARVLHRVGGGGLTSMGMVAAVMLSLAIAALLTLTGLAERVTPLTFELLLVAIGAGFGPIPSLTVVAMQNVVERHQLGISVGTMNFCRNLYATMLIAVFSAMLLAGSEGAASPRGALAAGDAVAAEFRPEGLECMIPLCCFDILLSWRYVLTYDLEDYRPSAGGPAGAREAQGGSARAHVDIAHRGRSATGHR